MIYFVGVPPQKESDEQAATNAAEDTWDTSPQIYRCNRHGHATRISAIEDGVAHLKVSPTGKHVAFTRDIKLDAEVTELYEDLPRKPTPGLSIN